MVIVLLGLFVANACSDDKVTLPDERLDIPLDTVPTSGFPGHGVDPGATTGENSEFCDLLAGLDMRTADVTTDAQFAMLQSKLETVETAAPPSARNMAKTWSSAMAGIVSDAQAASTAVPKAVERALGRNNVLIEADRALAGWLDRNCTTTTGS